MGPFESNCHLLRVKQYVERHIGGRISLDDVAQQAGLSPCYLSRLFRRETGQCFRDWLAVQRIEYAKHLLTTRAISVTQAGFSAGYGSISAFERAFKRLEGTSPRRFQLSQKLPSVRAVNKRREFVKKRRECMLNLSLYE